MKIIFSLILMASFSAFAQDTKPKSESKKDSQSFFKKSKKDPDSNPQTGIITDTVSTRGASTTRTVNRDCKMVKGRWKCHISGTFERDTDNMFVPPPANSGLPGLRGRLEPAPAIVPPIQPGFY
ncbi:MAG: hypothetical protein WC635_14645 [Bacteriovorax sp.]|jgi:hypothetical protein